MQMPESEHEKQCKFVDDDIPLPVENIHCPPQSQQGRKVPVVLVATGSFNPPTLMHLQMFDLAKDSLQSRGFHVVGGYMSPVNDAYKKQDLASAKHRIRMCELATAGSSFIMVDPWEASQAKYQRTLTVLDRVEKALSSILKEKLRSILLCGADLLESFTKPGVWIPEQVNSICKEHGIVCISRGDRDLQKLMSEHSFFMKNKENIIIIDDFKSNISSTEVRLASLWQLMLFICVRVEFCLKILAKGLPVEGLIPASLISYIKSNNLYGCNRHLAQTS